ncbi:hypothetical protein [Acinetobacter pittii]|uniref:hypothetical protein n=1 Tax=Acinetobacter pittii TaxID=48296 RepID=UPI003979EBD9
MLLNVYTSVTIDSVTVIWVPTEVPDLKDYAVWLSSTSNFDSTQRSNLILVVPNCVFPYITYSNSNVIWSCWL